MSNSYIIAAFIDGPLMDTAKRLPPEFERRAFRSYVLAHAPVSYVLDDEATLAAPLDHDTIDYYPFLRIDYADTPAQRVVLMSIEREFYRIVRTLVRSRFFSVNARDMLTLFTQQVS